MILTSTHLSPTLHNADKLDRDSDSPPEEADGLVVQVELLCLGVPPLVAEHQHDPGVQLGQCPGHVTLARLVENCADEPEIKGVAGQGEDVPENDKLILLMAITVIFALVCTCLPWPCSAVSCRGRSPSTAAPSQSLCPQSACSPQRCG